MKIEIRWAITVFFATAIVFAATSLVLLNSQDGAEVVATNSDEFVTPTSAVQTTAATPSDIEQDSLSTQLLDTPTTAQETTTTLAETTTTPAPEEFITFTPNEFRDLFDTSELPNLVALETPEPITGNASADIHIRSLAEARGYELQPIPNDAIGAVDGFRLQARALIAWQDMANAAEADGIDLRLISGLRLPEIQKNLFLGRLTEVTSNFAEISTGKYDSQIQEILDTSAIPGYSKHHTGYAIDIASESNSLTDFVNTDGYDWISANNFENAKEFGFVPSYPEGAESLGPLPEPWEYVWVGRDKLVN